MVSVADVLAVPDLDLGGVHLPAEEAEVRWVATSELVDPSPFLEGGELLLTTGLEMRGWRRQWGPYVERIVARNVVALGFATGLTHRRVPSGLLAASRDHDLNLFEVPRDTTFVAVSRAVAGMIDSDAESAARRSLAAQRQLTQAALQRSEPTLLVKRLAEIVGGAAALVGPDPIAPQGPARDQLDLALVTTEVDRLRPQGLRAATSVQSGTGSLVVQPIGLTGAPAAHLAVYVPGRVKGLERTTIAMAVSLLGLAAHTALVQRDADRRLRARALELLVDTDPRTASLVLGARAESSPALPERVRIARATGPDDAVGEALGAVEDLVSLAGRVRDELWLMGSPGSLDDGVARLAERGLLVGVGDARPVADARASWINAGHALTSATPAAPVVSWDQLVGEGALSVLDADRAAAFATSFLARLEDEQLVLTLRSFVQHHGSRLKVAAELGVHRNTVANRVAQIEAAIGGSLDDPQVRVSAWVALQVHSR